MDKSKSGVVMLVQCLCSNNHTLVSGMYEADKSSLAEVQYKIEMEPRKLGFTRTCGVCGSTVMHYEESQLPYKTLEDGIPYLRGLCERTDREQKRVMDKQRGN